MPLLPTVQQWMLTSVMSSSAIWPMANPLIIHIYVRGKFPAGSTGWQFPLVFKLWLGILLQAGW